MANDIKPTRVGDLRPSQLLYTFGIGSLLDLPNLSVLIMGLDDWDIAYAQIISEERLLAAIRERLGHQVKELRMPPYDQDEKDDLGGLPSGPQIGVPVGSFPRWARCPKCDRLAKIDSPLFTLKTHPFYPDRTRYVHSNCQKGNNPSVIPVRFLLACKNGHLDDFPWLDFVHKGQQCPNGQPMLRLREFGVTGEASDIIVQCDSCGAKRRVGEAVGQRGEDILPKCSGRHPHLGTFSESECGEKTKVTFLGASNLWFPLTLSALSIPRAEDKLGQMVEEVWGKLQLVDNIGTLKVVRQLGNVPTLADYSDEDVWEAIEKRKGASGATDSQDARDLKTPEWQIFSNPDTNINTPEFRLREVSPPQGYESFFTRTVLVERIREVRALVGFTRIESPGDFADGAELPDERRAPLSRRDPVWLPASEVRGEGVFLQFNEKLVNKWSEKEAVRQRAHEFYGGHVAWREMRSITPPNEGFPGIRYVLLHSFAHALMRQLSLECGYTAASIRERIYSRYAPDPADAMAGVLIYTAAADSEGTLGGLVSLGEPQILGRHIDQTLEQMRLCASDPLCSEHSPNEESTSIHGASCHACLFSPETSCERGNKYLDRASLVQTFLTQGISFFE